MRRKSTTPDMMKDYLQDALFALMEQMPFSRITVHALVEKAGVDRSTYYRHFGQKEAILQRFLDNLMNRLREEVPREGNRRQYLFHMFRFFGGYRRELLLIYDNGLSLLLLQVLENYFGDADTDEVWQQYRTAYHVGGVFNHFLLWFSRRMSDSPEALAESADAMLPRDFTPFLWRETILRSCFNFMTDGIYSKENCYEFLENERRG